MYQLAQFNIARARFSLDDSSMADFVSALDSVNAVADTSPGFVWRLQTDEGNATAVRVYDDARLLVNMSVWTSLENLKAFIGSPAHSAIMRRRSEWFEKLNLPYLVLWWVPEGHVPTVEEARGRLDHLRSLGPSEQAFDFTRIYSRPAANPTTLPASERGRS